MLLLSLFKTTIQLYYSNSKCYYSKCNGPLYYSNYMGFCKLFSCCSINTNSSFTFHFELFQPPLLGSVSIEV